MPKYYTQWERSEPESGVLQPDDTIYSSPSSHFLK